MNISLASIFRAATLAGALLMSIHPSAGHTDDAKGGHRSKLSEQPKLIHTWLFSDELLSPSESALRGELRDMNALRAFYEKYDRSPVWTEEGRSGPRALWLMGAVRDAEDDGLMPDDYHLDRLDSLHRAFAANQDAGSRAVFDLFLTDAFFLLATHLYYGKTDPAKLKADWGVLKSPRDLSMPDYLSALLEREDYFDGLNFFRPSMPAYAALRIRLRHYRLRLTAHPWQPITLSASLRPGESSEAMTEIRQRLILLGDCRTCAVEDPSLYDPVLEEAVKGFQKRHGLTPDGVIGRATTAALNIRPAERIRTAAVNLERMRWLPDNFGREYIIVNIADFQTNYIVDGDTLVSTRSVVGRPYRKTPVFSASMNHLVFSPTWTIPPGILRNDVLPAVRKNKGYLKEKNMVVIDRNGNVVPTESVDWNAASFPYMIRQNPGKQNALGLVKFMFPNTYSVYIHDTPSKELFRQEERAFSSGCIRIADPFDLAKALLRNSPQWTDERIRAAMNSGNEQRVNLSPAVPVYLVYFTAWSDDKHVHFRSDIYDRDAAVISGLTERHGRLK